MERRGPSTSQFCCNTGFEIMNLFQCNWSQHGFHIYLFVILSLETWWTQKTVTTWNKLCRNTQTHTHTLNIYQLPQFSTCVTIHSYLHLMWQLSLWFQKTLLPSLHNNTITYKPQFLWYALLQANLRIFFKVYTIFIVVFKH